MGFQAWSLWTDPDYVREAAAFWAEEDAFQREAEAQAERDEQWWDGVEFPLLVGWRE